MPDRPPCPDRSAFLSRYDGPGTLFYLDLPYAGNEGDYGQGLLAPEDFARMAGQLTNLEGAFILSINDTPGMRQTFADFHIGEARLSYSVTRRTDTPRDRELIISNRQARPGIL